MSGSIPFPAIYAMSVEDLRQLAHAQHTMLTKAIGELERVSGRLKAAEGHYAEEAAGMGCEGDTARAYRLGAHVGFEQGLGYSSANMAAVLRHDLAFKIDLTSPKAEAARG